MYEASNNSQTLDALETLERTDRTGQPPPGPILPDILVFDTDSKRMGNYGGFFLANDYNADQYNVARISDDPNTRERVNSATNRVPGVHLPELVHFALVAAGPLFTINEVFHFEAAVFCREVTRRDNGQYGLLKLTTKGPAAVKLHTHFTIAISDPLYRMSLYYHNLARDLHRIGTITKKRLDIILTKHVTAQMIWIPVEIQRSVQIGPSEQKSVIGTMVYTDEPLPNSHRFNSRWPTVSLDQLITPDAAGGLLLTGPIQEFCQQNRRHYEELLTLRASTKGTITQYATTNAKEPSFHLPRANPNSPTEAADQTQLLAHVRSQLTAIGKSEHAPDVRARMNQFGAPALEAMRPDQLNAFSIYVRGFATLLQEKRTAGPALPPTAR